MKVKTICSLYLVYLLIFILFCILYHMVVQDGDPLLARPLLYVYILLKNPSVDRKTKLFLWAVGSAFANKCCHILHTVHFFFNLKQANV